MTKRELGLTTSVFFCFKSFFESVFAIGCGLDVEGAFFTFDFLIASGRFVNCFLVFNCCGNFTRLYFHFEAGVFCFSVEAFSYFRQIDLTEIWSKSVLIYNFSPIPIVLAACFTNMITRT